MTALRLEVVAVADVTAGVRTVTFASADGADELPTYVPGSHIVLDCGGRPNAYSLTGDSLGPATYEISVLRVADGAGGSRWVHDELAVGDVVEALVPHSGFAPIGRAVKHLLVAGGIGVTPILSHLRAAELWGREVQVLYAHRPGRGAHVAEVRALAGDGAELFTDRAVFVDRLRVVLAHQPLGTHLYVCGPGPMMDMVLATAGELGWPPSRVHAEAFGIAALDPGAPFSVTLAPSGSTVEVPSGTSLLEALEAAGIQVPNRCRQGVCGECRLPVTAGAPLHRDLYLTDEEKRAGDAVMCCVSRADGPHLEVLL